MADPVRTPNAENELPSFRRRKKRPMTSFVQLFEAPTEGMGPEYMLRDLKIMKAFIVQEWRRFRGTTTMTKPADKPAEENGQDRYYDLPLPEKRPLTSFVQLFEAPTEVLGPEYMLQDLKVMKAFIVQEWRRFRERRQ